MGPPTGAGGTAAPPSVQRARRGPPCPGVPAPGILFAQIGQRRGAGDDGPGPGRPGPSSRGHVLVEPCWKMWGVCPELCDEMTQPTWPDPAVPQPRPEPAPCEGMLVLDTRTQECLGLTSPRKPTLGSQGPPPPFARLSSQACVCSPGVHSTCSDSVHSGCIYCFSRCVLG